MSSLLASCSIVLFLQASIAHTIPNASGFSIHWQEAVRRSFSHSRWAMMLLVSNSNGRMWTQLLCLSGNTWRANIFLIRKSLNADDGPDGATNSRSGKGATHAHWYWH